MPRSAFSTANDEAYVSNSRGGRALLHGFSKLVLLPVQKCLISNVAVILFEMPRIVLCLFVTFFPIISPLFHRVLLATIRF